jgi:hypothetical protein
MQGFWVVETGWRLPKIEVAGDMYLRRRRPTQGCRADDDDDDDDDDDHDDKEMGLENVDTIHLFQERVNGWFL